MTSVCRSQGCKFSDFRNFTSKYLKMFFNFIFIALFRWFYDKFRFSDQVSVSFQIFSVNFTYIPEVLGHTYMDYMDLS